MIDIGQLRDDIMRDEGLRLKPYVDSVGKLTIGYGRNLDDRGISRAEAEMLCSHDIAGVILELGVAFPWWTTMPPPAHLALANMAFNLGLPRLKTFVKMLAALQASDFRQAAIEALDSKWATQVGDRSQRIFDLYREAGGGHHS